MEHDKEHFERGKRTEQEQLDLNGLEKNHNTIREIDPRTGLTGSTIPDAFKNEGKSTTEIKNVIEQTLTRQLRLQERFSQNNGFLPELIINDHAQISKPLLNSAFIIKTYTYDELSRSKLNQDPSKTISEGSSTSLNTGIQTDSQTDSKTVRQTNSNKIKI